MVNLPVVRSVGNLSLPVDAIGNLDIAGPYADMLGVPTRQGNLKEVFEGQSIDEIVDRFSVFLRDGWISQVSLLKYDLLPEEQFRDLCQLMQDKTRQDCNPLMYFEIDREMIELFKHGDQVAFYKCWIGKVLNSVAKTSLAAKPKFRELQRFYKEDFEIIYFGRNYDELTIKHFNEKHSKPILTTGNNFPTHFEELMNYIYHCQETDVESKVCMPYPLINLSFLPSIPKGMVSVREAIEQALIRLKDVEFANDVSLAVSLAAMWLETDGRRTIAIPGWTADVLKNQYPGQKWYSGWQCEDYTYQEILHYGRVVELRRWMPDEKSAEKR